MTGTPIYSVDIHPDETKFATGGAGTYILVLGRPVPQLTILSLSLSLKGGRVHVWSLAPVLDSSLDNKPENEVPRKLCSVQGHEKSVNAVRWSPNGRYLATASCDGRIGIAERTTAPTGFGPAPTTETWRFKFYLPNHKMGTYGGIKRRKRWDD